jgi:Ca-activated chloride channel family protein
MKTLQYAAWLCFALSVTACGTHTGKQSVQYYRETPAPAPADMASANLKLEKVEEFKRASGIEEDVDKAFNTEGYDNIVENEFNTVKNQPLSTFSIDVDEAAYSNVRRYLNNGILPPKGAVRIEEMINYFDYEYQLPEKGKPFSVTTEIAPAPWNKNHQLVHIGLQGYDIPKSNLPASNLVFLIDVSGSMQDENKLPLVKRSLNLLTDQLHEEDHLSIVVYAGNAGLVLPSTSGANKQAIKAAINRLEAGGSTAGGEGLELAYKTAAQHFLQEGNNRIIICTDGDFNVGASSDDDMVRLIEDKRKSGIYLTALGFGMGNYKDGKMQQIADKGNGNHAYIDNLNEAKKVLLNEFASTLFTIAKDVKIQIEFNPAKVQSYRLIGYENRMLAKEDFNDDTKDAGEIGAGHTVTALYEIIPVGVKNDFDRPVDPLKYQQPENLATVGFGDEIMNVKIRYKHPDSDISKLITQPVKNTVLSFGQASDNFRFSAAVASFGMLLRDSKFKQQANYTQVLELAKSAKGADVNGYREEFIDLVKTAEALGTTANK